MQNPAENPGYLDLAVLQSLQVFTAHLKARITEMLQIKTADRVIDVGCGPGIDTIPMASLVGEEGFIVGIDYDEAMIAEATRLAWRGGVANGVIHIAADALNIPFQSGYFDGCRSERLLQHVADAGNVFTEMCRVTKSGGRIVVADTDWGTLSIDALNVEIERRIVRFRAGMYCNGYAGRQIYRMMKERQLQNVSLEVYPVVWTDYSVFRATSFSLNEFEKRLIDSRTVSEKELRCFLDDLEEADRRETFYANGNIVVVAGQKP